MKEKGK